MHVCSAAPHWRSAGTKKASRQNRCEDTGMMLYVPDVPHAAAAVRPLRAHRRPHCDASLEPPGRAAEGTHGPGILILLTDHRFCRYVFQPATASLSVQHKLRTHFSAIQAKPWGTYASWRVRFSIGACGGCCTRKRQGWARAATRAGAPASISSPSYRPAHRKRH